MTVPHDDRSVSLLLKEGKDALYRDEHSVAESLGEEVLARARGEADPALVDEALALVADSRRLMGQFAHSLITLAQLVNEADNSDTTRSYALLALSNFVECAIHLSLSRDKIDAFVSHAEAEAKTLDTDWLKSRILLQKSRVLRDRHDFGRASEAAVRSLWFASHAAGQNLIYAMHCYQQAVARSMLDMGDIGNAYLRYQEILTDSGTSLWAKVCGHIGLSRVLLARGQTVEAVNHSTLAIAEAHHMNPLAVTYAIEASYDAYQSAGDEEMAAKAARDLLFYTARCDSVHRRYKALIRAAEMSMLPEGADDEMARLERRLIESCGFADGLAL